MIICYAVFWFGVLELSSLVTYAILYKTDFQESIKILDAYVCNYKWSIIIIIHSLVVKMIKISSFKMNLNVAFDFENEVVFP